MVLTLSFFFRHSDATADETELSNAIRNAMKGKDWKSKRIQTRFEASTQRRYIIFSPNPTPHPQFSTKGYLVSVLIEVASFPFELSVLEILISWAICHPCFAFYTTFSIYTWNANNWQGFFGILCPTIHLAIKSQNTACWMTTGTAVVSILVEVVDPKPANPKKYQVVPWSVIVWTSLWIISSLIRDK